MKTQKIRFKDVSLFMPAYNCDEIVEKSVSRTYKLLKNISDTFELVVVNDNSTDKTLERLLRLKKRYPYLKVINMKNGPSRRENVAKAMKKARYDTILFQDIDLSVDLKYIPIMINKIKSKEYDIAIGSRYNGVECKRKWNRYIISRAYNFFLRIYFKSDVNDHQCGFKSFKKEVLLKLIDELGYDKTFKRGWFWDAELLIRAQKRGFKICELPVEWRNRDLSTFNLRRELKMIPCVLTLKLKEEL